MLTTLKQHVHASIFKKFGIYLRTPINIVKNGKSKDGEYDGQAEVGNFFMLDATNAVGSYLAIEGNEPIPNMGVTSMHTPIIDVDFPIEVFPSSTPGHWHIYFDKPMPGPDYKKLLKALNDSGIIEDGFYNASVERGYSCLRLPDRKKDNSIDKNRFVTTVEDAFTRAELVDVINTYLTKALDDIQDKALSYYQKDELSANGYDDILIGLYKIRKDLLDDA